MIIPLPGLAPWMTCLWFAQGINPGQWVRQVLDWELGGLCLYLGTYLHLSRLWGIRSKDDLKLHPAQRKEGQWFWSWKLPLFRAWIDLAAVRDYTAFFEPSSLSAIPVCLSCRLYLKSDHLSSSTDAACSTPPCYLCSLDPFFSASQGDLLKT